MLVCSCNFISKAEIEEVVVEFLDQDRWRLITPGKVYSALSKRGKCCGCFPNVISIIVEASTDYHRKLATPETKIIPFIARIVEEHERCETMRRLAAMTRRKRAA